MSLLMPMETPTEKLMSIGLIKGESTFPSSLPGTKILLKTGIHLILWRSIAVFNFTIFTLNNSGKIRSQFMICTTKEPIW